MTAFVTQNSTFALFLLLAIGSAIGSFSWRGISLGASAVLLVALVFGNYGIIIPPEVRDFGLVLFVYSIGLQVGPQFFKAAKEQGKKLFIFSLAGLALSAATIYAVAKLFHIPADIATGMFSGGLTSTPALAAAVESAKMFGFSPDNISVGYGIAYPISLISMVLMLQLLPHIARKRMETVEARALESRQFVERLVIKQFRIENPACFGKSVGDMHMHHFGKVNISRIYRDSAFCAATADAELHEGDIVTVVGPAHDVEQIGMLFGKETTIALVDGDVIMHDIHALSSDVIGKTIGDLDVLKKYDVVITRIKKPEYDLPAVGAYEIAHGDILHAVGKREDVDRFASFAEHMDKKADETNFLPYVLGLMGGILIGLIPINLYGGVQITLGVATGAFLVSLVIGYLGKIGSLRIYVPQAAFNLSRDLGLMLFLAGVGTNAGSKIAAVLMAQGPALFLAAFIIVAVSVLAPLAMLLFIRFFTFSSISGSLAGYMTNLPALLSARNANASAAMLDYATFYPYALILKIIIIQILMIFLQAI